MPPAHGLLAGGVLALGLAAAIPAPALAQALEPIDDRGYTLDLHEGSALGSARIVGMGGTALATAEGSAGLIANPAAAAVRPATSTRRWDWDWHLDWLSPELGSDFDNNGIPTQQGLSGQLFTLGLLGQYRQWGLGLAGTTSARAVAVDADGNEIHYDATIARFGLARSFRADELTVGIASRVASLHIDWSSGGSTMPLFHLSGAALEAGALWRPPALDLRVGIAGSLPVTAADIEVQNCDPLDCQGYILPEKAAAPWSLGAGVAWRLGPTRWNRKVEGEWRDERAVLLAADLLVSGGVADGAGFEAFAQRALQRSGRTASLSARGGAEYEWVPGRFRLRGGTYWEPSRFDDVRGRLHLTAGFDWRLFGFTLWGDPYRIRLTFTGDVAARYGNTGLSVGFWH